MTDVADVDVRGQAVPIGSSPRKTTRLRTRVGLTFVLYLVLLGLVLFAAIQGGSNLLFWLAGVLAGGFFLSAFGTGSMLRRVSVRRIAPVSGVVGQPLTLNYEVRNTSRRIPVFNIQIVERPAPPGDGAGFFEAVPAWVLHVGAGERVHGEAEIVPKRRGAVTLGTIEWWTEFPFGILTKTLRGEQRQRLLIHPRVYPLRGPTLQRLVPRGMVGDVVTSAAGLGDDYYGLREFRPGDSLRHVAWKATANRDQLVAVQRARPHPPRLRLVLNLAPGAEADAEEDAICLAASLLHAADRSGFEIALSVLGVPTAPIPVGGGHWHRERIMGALAEIDLDGPRFTDLSNLPDVHERAGVVVVHVGAIEPNAVAGEAVHVSGARMDDLVERPGEAGGAP